MQGTYSITEPNSITPRESALESQNTALGDLDFDLDGTVVTRARFRCLRPSIYAGWILPGGEVVPARCGAPNRCPYCAYLATIENAIVVGLDAERYGHPLVGMTLTTVDPQHSMPAFRRDIEQVLRLLRRELGRQVEYLAMVEWTTGRSRRAKGHRRVHVHVLLRGCCPEDAEAMEGDIRRVWSRRTGATRVEIRALQSAAGATAYLIYHHRKREQSPPEGWSGKRMRPSKGYYGEPVAELRAEARRLTHSKRLRRVANRLIDWEYVDQAPDEIYREEWAAAIAEARRAANMVTFVKFDRHGGIASWKNKQAA